MGVFRVAIEVGNPQGGDMVGVAAIVDTSSVHTMLPESLLTQLRIEPMLQKRFRFADGNEQIHDVGLCRISWMDERFDCPVIFGREEQYLLGATTLEIFDLVVDPGERRLIPQTHYERPY